MTDDAPVTICAQCCLKALLTGKPAPAPFRESPEEHLDRVHGDPIARAAEADWIREQLDERQRLRAAARFN